MLRSNLMKDLRHSKLHTSASSTKHSHLLTGVIFCSYLSASCNLISVITCGQITDVKSRENVNNSIIQWKIMDFHLQNPSTA